MQASQATVHQKLAYIRNTPEYKKFAPPAEFYRQLVNNTPNLNLDRIVNEALKCDINQVSSAIQVPMTRHQMNGAETQYRDFVAAALQHQRTGDVPEGGSEKRRKNESGNQTELIYTIDPVYSELLKSLNRLRKARLDFERKENHSYEFKKYVDDLYLEMVRKLASIGSNNATTAKDFYSSNVCFLIAVKEYIQFLGRFLYVVKEDQSENPMDIPFSIPLSELKALKRSKTKQQAKVRGGVFKQQANMCSMFMELSNHKEYNTYDVLLKCTVNVVYVVLIQGLYVLSLLPAYYQAMLFSPNTSVEFIVDNTQKSVSNISQAYIAANKPFEQQLYEVTQSFDVVDVSEEDLPPPPQAPPAPQAPPVSDDVEDDEKDKDDEEDEYVEDDDDGENGEDVLQEEQKQVDILPTIRNTKRKLDEPLTSEAGKALRETDQNIDSVSAIATPVGSPLALMGAPPASTASPLLPKVPSEATQPKEAEDTSNNEESEEESEPDTTVKRKSKAAAKPKKAYNMFKGKPTGKLNQVLQPDALLKPKGREKRFDKSASTNQGLLTEQDTLAQPVKESTTDGDDDGDDMETNTLPVVAEEPQAVQAAPPIVTQVPIQLPSPLPTEQPIQLPSQPIDATGGLTVIPANNRQTPEERPLSMDDAPENNVPLPNNDDGMDLVEEDTSPALQQAVVDQVNPLPVLKSNAASGQPQQQQQEEEKENEEEEDDTMQMDNTEQTQQDRNIQELIQKYDKVGRDALSTIQDISESIASVVQKWNTEKTNYEIASVENRPPFKNKFEAMIHELQRLQQRYLDTRTRLEADFNAITPKEFEQNQQVVEYMFFARKQLDNLVEVIKKMKTTVEDRKNDLNSILNPPPPPPPPVEDDKMEVAETQTGQPAEAPAGADMKSPPLPVVYAGAGAAAGGSSSASGASSASLQKKNSIDELLDGDDEEEDSDADIIQEEEKQDIPEDYPDEEHDLPEYVTVCVFVPEQIHQEPAIVAFDNSDVLVALEDERSIKSILYNIDNPYIDFLRTVAGTSCQDLSDILVYDEELVRQIRMFSRDLSLKELQDESMHIMDAESRLEFKKLQIFRKFLGNWEKVRRIVVPQFTAAVSQTMLMVSQFSAATVDTLICGRDYHLIFASCVAQAFLKIEYHNPRRYTPIKKVSPAAIEYFTYLAALKDKLTSRSGLNYFPAASRRITAVPLSIYDKTRMVMFDDDD